MDFGSFENSIDKNIETDKASDKFDQQLRAYKDAGNSLTSAKSELEKAASSLLEVKDNLNKATDKADAVTKAIDSFIAKVRDIKGSYGIWSDGSYERRQHSIGLVLIHDTHHDVNVEL